MTVSELALGTGLQVEELLEAIFDLPLDTDWIRDEHQSLQLNRNPVFVRALAKHLHLRVTMVRDPAEEAEKVKVDRDARRRAPAGDEELVGRAPVVAIMGHIDHGKTSLLDHLRKSSIVAGEAGGITQHIGAFAVRLEGVDRTVTFIDTPGHAAFTAMRARGAATTDIVILIIDACEGVLEQTRESLRIIRQARAPFVVALNKMDKPGADAPAVRAQLAEEGVVLEERGGEVQCVPISALRGTNVKQLIEAVLAQVRGRGVRGEG